MNNKTFVTTHKKKIIVALAIAITAIMLFGIFFAMHTPAKTPTDASGVIGGVPFQGKSPITVAGTATPSQTQNAGQETTYSWYAIDEVKWFSFPAYGELKIGTVVLKDGTFQATPYNADVLNKEKKYYIVNVKIKKGNKIYQTKEFSSFGTGITGGTGLIMDNWKKGIFDDNVILTDVFWQPEFQFKDNPTSPKKEVVVNIK